MKRSAGSSGLMENWLRNGNKKSVSLSGRCETGELSNSETGSFDVPSTSTDVLTNNDSSHRVS